MEAEKSEHLRNQLPSSFLCSDLLLIYIVKKTDILCGIAKRRDYVAKLVLFLNQYLGILFLPIYWQNSVCMSLSERVIYFPVLL